MLIGTTIHWSYLLWEQGTASAMAKPNMIQCSVQTRPLFPQPLLQNESGQPDKAFM